MVFTEVLIWAFLKAEDHLGLELPTSSTPMTGLALLCCSGTRLLPDGLCPSHMCCHPQSQLPLLQRLAGPHSSQHKPTTSHDAVEISQPTGESGKSVT